MVARGPWGFVPGCAFGSYDCVQVVGNFENSFLECCFDLQNNFLLSHQSFKICNSNFYNCSDSDRVRSECGFCERICSWANKDTVIDIYIMEDLYVKSYSLVPTFYRNPIYRIGILQSSIYHLERFYALPTSQHLWGQKCSHGWLPCAFSN